MTGILRDHEQLELFTDVAIRPTPAMRRGDAFLAQCAWCGTLVCVPGPSVDGTPRRPDLGACPSCRRSAGWWRQDLGNGPFHPRTWALTDVVATCPICGSEWTDTTELSWWLKYDRCYACVGEATGANERIPTREELDDFARGGHA